MARIKMFPLHLAKHGRHHNINPSHINYQANLWALREEGCTHVLATNACGSLQEEIRPGEIVILDQFIDRTVHRKMSFYDGTTPDLFPGVCHIPMAEPYCPQLRSVLISAATELKIAHHPTGTCVCVEGPRFSSKAESFVFRSYGAHTIGMTTCPEVYLAKELGLCYAAIALPTDYDCWKDGTADHVNVQAVLKTFAENSHKATDILLTTIQKLATMDFDEHMNEHKKLVAAGIQSF